MESDRRHNIGHARFWCVRVQAPAAVSESNRRIDVPSCRQDKRREPRALAAWIFSGVAAISLALIVGLAIKGLVRRNRITARPAGGAVPVPVISDQVRAIGKISLWTAILGLIVPILLALVSILLQRS